MARAKTKPTKEPMREVKTMREVPGVPTCCDKPMAKHVVGLMQKRYRYKCNTCESERPGEVIE